MAQPTLNPHQASPQDLPGGYITLAEIEYLVDTGRVAFIMLAGTPLVSVDGLRDYLRRHQESHDEPTPSELQPMLA